VFINVDEHPLIFLSVPRLCAFRSSEWAVAHAARRSHGGQCRRQDGYHHLNHCLPSFSFHTSFLSFFTADYALLFTADYADFTDFYL
jgi:hypothetical protein